MKKTLFDKIIFKLCNLYAPNKMNCAKNKFT